MNSALARRIASIEVPLRTRRLELHWPEASRDRAAVELLQDPSISAWTPIPFPYSLADARLFRRRQLAARRRGTDLAFQIVRRSDEALVGGVGLHELSERRSRGELGYWIGAPFRRNGYATEAAQRVIRLAFGPLALHRVEAGVFPGNRRSQRVLIRAGLRFEGRQRESFPWRGGFRDDLLYARVAGPARRAPASRSASPTRRK